MIFSIFSTKISTKYHILLLLFKKERNGSFAILYGKTGGVQRVLDGVGRYLDRYGTQVAKPGRLAHATLGICI